MTNLVKQEQGVYQAGEWATLITDGTYQATRRSIVIPPGHGNGGRGYQPPNTGFEFARALAEAGFAVYTIDAGGVATWGGPAMQTALGNAVNHMLSLFGGTKVGLLGYSMGGLGTLNYIKRNPTLVAGAYFLEPVTDLDWVHSTAGYTPPYDISGVGVVQAVWNTEAETAYSATSATWATQSAGYRVHDEPQTFRGLCPMTFAHATDDTVVPSNATVAFVQAVNWSTVTLRAGTLTGNHTGIFTTLPAHELVDFYDSLTW